MDRCLKENNKWNVVKVITHNIILMGRSDSGKTTVKKTLIDPNFKYDQFNPSAETKDVDVVSLQVERMSAPQSPADHSHDNANNRFSLNIIDTPGLFELQKVVGPARDSDRLLMTIRDVLTKIGSSFHYICFCVSVIDGIRKEDIETLHNALRHFGLKKFNEHICIIITRCEMKNDTQRANLEAQLRKELPVVKQFNIKVRFAGCLNDEPPTGRATTSITDQFKNITSYQKELLKLFTTPIQPCELKASDILVPDYMKATPPAPHGQN